MPEQPDIQLLQRSEEMKAATTERPATNGQGTLYESVTLVLSDNSN
jgi:hypothetical protein